MVATEPPPASRPSQSSRRSRERVSVGFDVRFDLEAHVSHVSEHNFYQGFSENLSDGGLFVQTYQVYKVGDVLSLQLTLPDDADAIVVRGVVRWVRAYDEPSNTKPGFGLQFQGLEPVDQKRIERFLRLRSPLFYEE